MIPIKSFMFCTNPSGGCVLPSKHGFCSPSTTTLAHIKHSFNILYFQQNIHTSTSTFRITLISAGSHSCTHILTCITSCQGVTKRCRISWLTNSALVYEPKCGRRGEVAGSQTQPMSTAVHMEPK